jgi:hypothetical protein
LNALQFDYPTPYLFLCAGIAILFGIVLYFKDSRWADKSILLPWILGVFRAIVVFILCVLLLSPFLTYFEEKTEKPVVLLAIDNSESMKMEDDSLLNQLRELPQRLGSELNSFDHINITFGESINVLDTLAFEETKTNISSVFDYVQDDLKGQNIGGVVMVSDGMYNLGQNPLYALSGLGVPIYPLAVGDTSAQKDISLVDVFHNDIAYRGDRFKVQVDIKAKACKGLDSRVSLYSYENGKPRRIDQKEISIDKNSFFQTIEFTSEAKEAGVKKYVVTLDTVRGETTQENNRKTFYIDVIDARQKVLILGGAPHPDITALKQSLIENKNYDVNVVLAGDDLPNINTFDILVLHQIPFTKKNPKYLDKVLGSKLPKLFVTGLETDFKKLNTLPIGLKVNIKRGTANTVSARYNSNFSAFSFPEEKAEQLINYPPLETPFADFNISAGEQVLFYQQIGEVGTQYPLVSLGRTNRKKRTAFILGEGFWRWRLYEFSKTEDMGAADQMLGQIIQYLSVSEDKRRFRTKAGKNLYDENEPIQIRAEFYNENYELTNSPDAFLEIKSMNGESYPYTLSKMQDFYTLNVGFLPAGEYSYTAHLDWNGERFSHTGQFAVQEIQLELYRTQANYNLLNLIANETGGDMLTMDHLEKDLSKIRESETAQPILYAQPTTRALINLPLIFGLIMLLLTMEWFTRRWVGSY